MSDKHEPTKAQPIGSDRTDWPACAAYLTAPTYSDQVIDASQMSDEFRQELAEGRAWLRQQVESLLPVVFGGEGTDEEADAANRLLLLIEDGKRPRLVALAWNLLWCSRVIHRRVWSMILAHVWNDGKGGLSLRQAGFGVKTMAAMFELAEPKWLMNAEDFAVFNSLPDQVVVYRGVAGIPASKARYGMSWTLDRDKAAWFSTAHGCGEPLVLGALARKADVLAYFDERSEAEVVVRPGRVRNARRIDAAAAAMPAEGESLR